MLTSSNIAATAAALVGQDMGLAALISRDVEADFTAGAGATVKVRVPGAVAASVRGIGDKSTPLTVDEIAEQYIDVTLTDDVYNSVLLSAGDLDLEIESFAEQVLAPQTRAITRYIERKTAEAMKATPEDLTIAYSATAPAKAIAAMRSKLRAYGVPADAPLHVAVGAGVYADLLDADAIDDQGKVRGVLVHESTRLAADELVMFVKEAFALVVRAPQPPAGAPYAASVKEEGFALSHIRAYDSSVNADRSTVQTFLKVQPMPLAVDAEDGTISLVPSGGAVRVLTSTVPA